MVSNKLIRQLAQQSLREPEALQVLGDAMQEANLDVVRDSDVVEGQSWEPDNTRSWLHPWESAEQPTRDYARAVLKQVKET